MIFFLGTQAFSHSPVKFLVRFTGLSDFSLRIIMCVRVFACLCGRVVVCFVTNCGPVQRMLAACLSPNDIDES